MSENIIDKRLQYLKERKDKLLGEIKLEEEYLKNRGIKVKKINTSRPVGSLDDKEIDINDYINKKNKYTDKDFFNNIKPLLNEIMDSNGCRYYKKINKKIGMIADEFLFKSYEGITNIIYITPDNYKDYKDLDVFIVASAWKGLSNEWKGLAYQNSDKVKKKVYEIIKYYKSTGTKIVFYSKEDPVNYDRFVELAKRCDYIFTTAEECIESYKKECNNSNVYLLEFGVNPLYHNPIGSRKHKKFESVFFAGSWYGKYPKRNEDMNTIFEGVIEANKDLKIIDRNYNIENTSSYFFPEKYLKYISPAIEHQYLQKVHKLFDWAINLNTIQFSNTMYANRIYELQAIGNIIISNYSIGVNNKFPNVILVNNKDEVKNIINSFTEEDIIRHQNIGLRNVMSKETTFDRLEYLLNTISIDTNVGKRKVLVVAEELNDITKKAFERQAYPYKDIILEKDFTNQMKEEYDIISFFGKNRMYEEFYLEDMVNGFKYTNCDYITKDTYYNGEKLIQGIEHDYVNILKDKYKTLFWSESFTFEQLIDIQDNQNIMNGYSIDRFEFNEKDMTVKNEIDKSYKLSLIIPVYNNGKHLLNKCFKSLKRSTLFKDMEIIIVDDGSTDNYTPSVVKRLGRHYENVKYYLYNDGGSGSASRPRNKGFELSTSNLITYLDPDNEAINDGYYKLYNEIKDTNYDLVVGNIIKITDKVIRLKYYKDGYDEIKNTKEYLKSTKFKAQSIQALIVKREIIQKNNLDMVKGALGQDTLFFQELLLNSKKVKVINEDIHIYYGAVEGSVVNTISKKLYEKYFILEKERYRRLKKYGLLKEYVNKRFEVYFDKWYLEKLKRIKDTDLVESVDILYDIYKLYIEKENIKNERINKFIELCKEKKYQSIKKLIE